MPLKLPDQLPAINLLRKENIFIMEETHASHQDIRPLKLLILNLMPLKITTETDLLRLLANSPLQIEIDFMKIKGHCSKNTPASHMKQFYKDYELIFKNKYDGMIITGAPVEQFDFEDVDYWEEIQMIFDWTNHNVTSTFFICWAAQAGLYHFYNIPKYQLPGKMSGVFNHQIINKRLPIFRGFDDEYYVPHSRHTEIKEKDVIKNPALQIISKSEKAGINMIMAQNGRQFYITGHPEYSRYTLDLEYKRDQQKNMPVDIPLNYYPDNAPNLTPTVKWKSAANLLFSNWLNYYVYQKTPFNLDEIK